MKLAIFDLDNTLLDGDSDHAWGEFMVAENLVPQAEYRETNDAFYEEYKRGVLDMVAYQKFVLAPLRQFSAEQLKELHLKFMHTVVTNMLLPKARELIEKHRQAGHTLMVITATNRFITEPIVKEYGIENLLCTEPEVLNGSYTGKIIGEPCYQAGKIHALEAWLKKENMQPEYSWFYSDSFNDIPLMEKVNEAIAVNPDEKLKAHALTHGWSLMNLREHA